VLVDRAPTISARTRADFRALGWDIVADETDVFDWLMRPAPEQADMMLANLFLHHFDEGELSTLFAAIARQTNRFIACEPRRSRTALAGASLLFLLGCNDVTRHDAKHQRARRILRRRALSALAERTGMAPGRGPRGAVLAFPAREPHVMSDAALDAHANAMFRLQRDGGLQLGNR
jgi:hypothetical protein